jgi:hypothetical protein
MASSWSTASLSSIFEITHASEPASSIRVFSAATSVWERTNERAT